MDILDLAATRELWSNVFVLILNLHKEMFLLNCLILSVCSRNFSGAPSTAYSWMMGMSKSGDLSYSGTPAPTLGLAGYPCNG